jgi:hypothetical protein
MSTLSKQEWKRNGKGYLINKHIDMTQLRHNTQHPFLLYNIQHGRPECANRYQSPGFSTEVTEFNPHGVFTCVTPLDIWTGGGTGRFTVYSLVVIICTMRFGINKAGNVHTP